MGLTDARMRLRNPCDPEPEPVEPMKTEVLTDAGAVRLRIPPHVPARSRFEDTPHREATLPARSRRRVLYSNPKTAMLGIVVTLLLLVATPVAADFVAGVKAYERGDYATALQELRPLAEQGHADAQFFLAFMYFLGQGIPKDDEQAVFWIRRAAEQGLAMAQANLGVMYAEGEGVPKDDEQAVFWFLQAAEQGFAGAQYNLGLAYDKGAGVPVDDEQAAFWYCQAAEQGYAGAQNSIGTMYAKGEGVPKDYIQAYAWFNLAAARGDKSAKTNRTRIRKLMTPDQVAEGEKLSRELAAQITGRCGG